jgi:transposase
MSARATTGYASGRTVNQIIESLLGMGPILGAELIAAAGDFNGYANAGRLASAAGLVPVPRDSGRRTGNLHRPTRYSRKLRRVFYLSASAAMMREGPNRDFYLKKRGEGLKRSSLLLADGSTCCGPCSATTASSNAAHQAHERLDNFIENLS